MPSVFASTGIPGRLGDIQLDVIEDIRAPRSYDRTNVPLERGAPITNHRQRVPFQLSVTVLISDVPPVVVAPLGLWETGHVNKVKQRLRDLQASGDEVQFFDGREIWRTPTGARVWVLDEIDEGKNAEHNSSATGAQAWRAVLTLGEVSRVSTQFTTLVPDVDGDITAATDGILDKGQQSTEDVPADQAANIPG